MAKCKKRNRLLVFITLCLFSFSLIPSPAFADGNTSIGKISRLAGNDRIETALAICEQGWQQSERIVLAPANQENLVDALSAVALAGQEQAPILLTDKNKLDSRVLSRIRQLNPGKVYAVGALSGEVTETLRDEFALVNRSIQIEVIKGKDRQETSDKINRLLQNKAGMFLIGPNAVADALSAGSYAYANRYGYIFSYGNTSMPNDLPAYAIGGQAAVGDGIRAVRIWGKDRYETNRKFIETLSHRDETVYIANGSDRHLSDALAGAALAGKTGSPIYYTERSGKGLTELIQEKIRTGSSVVILGGTSALSDESQTQTTGASLAVSDVKGLNLLQLAVVFNKAVNRASAETVQNYIFNGRVLSNSDASADLQPDQKTVMITLSTPQTQYSDVLMAVKEHQIYAADRKSTAPGYEGSVTVFDVQVPQVKRISGEGNRKLTIWFSEAIELSDAVLHYKDWKLDGWGAAAAGLQTVKILRAIDVGGQTFGSGLELYFGRGLAEGNHVLEIAEMDSLAAGSRLFRDGAGYRLENKRLYVSVQGAAGPPAVKVERTEGHAVYLRFDRPMYSNPQGLAADASDPASVLNVNQYTINSVHGSVSSAEFIEDSDRKSVKLVVSSDILATGVNLITYGKSIEDLFGLRLVADSEGEDLRQIFTVEEDNRKPMAEMVEVVNPSLIRVTFSEQVNGLYALNKGNYVLKDRNGASIPIDSITAVPESNMYEIRPSQDLYGDGYTLKIMTIPDMAIKPNFMDTVLDKGNYRLIDGDTPSNYKALPAGTRIETGPESRSAVITLPSAYLADA